MNSAMYQEIHLAGLDVFLPSFLVGPMVPVISIDMFSWEGY